MRKSMEDIFDLIKQVEKFQSNNNEKQERRAIPETEEIWRYLKLGGKKEGQLYGSGQKIGVVGISRKAGTTVLTTLLAKKMANEGIKLSVVDLGNHAVYRSIVEQEKQEQSKNKNRTPQNIYWIPAEAPSISLEAGEQFQRIYATNTQIAIYDFSQSCEEKTFGARLSAMSFLVVVIDPMPSAMMEGYPLMKKIKGTNIPFVTIINKWEDGIRKRELREFLELKEMEWLPQIPIKLLYEAEYGRIPMYGMVEIQAIVEEPMKRIMSRLIGKGLSI